MSMRLSKRILSTVLAALLVTGTALPSVTAFAAGGDNETIVIVDKDILSIGSRKVGLHITNIPDFAEFEDFQLLDEDGDGIYTGSFENLIADFPEYDEVSFIIRLDGSSSYKWGAENENGNTYQTDIPVTVKLKEGETLSVSFDTRDDSLYRKWKINASAALIPENERLSVFVGDPEMDSMDYDLIDEDGDRIFEADLDNYSFFGSDFYVRWDYADNLRWGSDGNGGTEFGSDLKFPYTFIDGEMIHLTFDATDEDYRNWKLTYTSRPDIHETDNGSNLKLLNGDDIDQQFIGLEDYDNDGIYTAVMDYSELYLEGAAYVFVDGYEEYVEGGDDNDLQLTYTFKWGNDGSLADFIVKAKTHDLFSGANR